MPHRLNFHAAMLLPTLIAAGALLVPAEAASPMDKGLVRLVGQEAGLCVEINDLSKRIPQFADSPLFNRIELLPVYRAWRQSSEFQKLAHFKKAIERHTGQPLERFARNLFGQSIVLAVYPKASGAPAGVLLLKAADGEALESSISAWNREERVAVSSVTVGESRYFHREQRNPQKKSARSQFYYQKGIVFALSDDESLIRGIAERDSGRPGELLLESENYQKAIRSLPEDCWATLYFNPQTWRPRWQIDEGRTQVEEFLIGLWKRCQAVGVGLRADEGVSLDFVLHFDPHELPEPWNRWVESTRGFPEFLNRVPESAFLVFAGKQSFSGFDEGLLAGLDKKTRQQWGNARQIGRGLLLGMDLFDDVLPQLQPNWGFYIVARQPLDPSAVPVEGLLAFEIPLAANGAKPEKLRSALSNALSTALNLLAAIQNAQENTQPATVKKEKQDAGVIHWVESLGAYRPAYCLSKQYLVFASSPVVLREFLAPENPKLTEDTIFRAWSESGHPTEGQLVFVNWRAIRDFMRENHDFLAKQAADSEAQPHEEASKRLRKLAEALAILDGVFFNMQIQEDRIHVTLGGVTVE